MRELENYDSRELNDLEPESVDDAQAIRGEINRRILLIDISLKDPDRKDPNTGERMLGDQYWDWRKRAIAAQSFARLRMRYLKDWISQHSDGGNAEAKRIASALEGIDGSLARIAQVLEEDEE